MTAQTTTLDVSYRNIGAILGALMALGAIGILYLVTSISEVESLLLIRTVLSGETLEAGAPIQPLMLGVPSVSAAIGGWLIAPYAIAGDRASGVAMGSVTYLVATIAGPVVAFASVPGAPLSELMSALPMVILFALFLLFPVLLLCAGFGTAWAALVRRALGTPAVPAVHSPGRLPVNLFVLGFAVLGLGWLPLAVLLGGLFSGGAWLD